MRTLATNQIRLSDWQVAGHNAIKENFDDSLNVVHPARRMFRGPLAINFRGKCFINNYDASVVFQVCTKVGRVPTHHPAYRFPSGGVKEATTGK